MFMVKDEYANIKNLLWIRIKTQAMSFKGVCILLALFIFVPFGGTIWGIVQSDTIRFYNTTDFSITILFGIAARSFIQMLTYKSTNDKLSVYPQTNNSRFISSLFYNFVEVFVFASIVLAIYLFQYGIIWLMTVFVDNVHLALDFDLSLVVVGFFVHIAYSLLIVMIIELVGVVLRKWTYYAIVVFVAILSLMIANFNTVIGNVLHVLAFLTREPSLIIFFLKVIALLLVITTIAVVINRYTVYYKNHGRTLNKDAVIGCTAVTLVIMMVVNFRLFNMTTIEQGHVIITEGAVWPADDFFAEFEEVRIDISHLPNGSNIEVRVENRGVLVDAAGSRFFSDTPVTISGVESLQNIQGDTLILSYRPPFLQVNGIMLSDFANSQLIAYLEGNVLFVDSVTDNAQVVILPIWNIARQFELFRDRDIFRASLIGFSGGGDIAANVWLRVE